MTSRTPLVAVAAALALVAGFVLRAPLERAGVLVALRAASGASVDAVAVERDEAGDYVLRDAVVTVANGAGRLSVPRATIRREAAGVTIALERPQLLVDAPRLQQALGDMHAAFARATHGEANVTMQRGAIDVTRAQQPAALSLDAVTGTLQLRDEHVRFDGTLALEEGGRTYPLVAAIDPGETQSLHAQELPLEPIGRLAPVDAPLQLRGGTLVAFAADDRGGNWRASGHVSGGSFSLTGNDVARVHGDLRYDGDGVGSRELAGTLAGMPFAVAGEVHGLGPAGAWLGPGWRDLRALSKIVATVAAEPRLRWSRVEATAPGATFAQYGLATGNGPLAITLLAVDPSEPTLRFDTAIAEDRVISGGERTSALAVRTHALAGVNGDYFDIGRTYQPQGMLLRDGRIVRGPTDRAALVIDRNRRVTFAEFALRGEVRTSHGIMRVTELNDWPPGNATVVTPALGKTLPVTPGRTFFALEPAGSDGRYRVTDVEPLDRERPVRFGIAVGPLVRIAPPVRGEIVTLDYSLAPNVAGAVAGIGGGPMLLRDGHWYDDPHAPAPDERNYRWPVIALAREADGTLLFAAVDGRHPERSVGATRPEFAQILQRLGARDAMALDSGGSVTLVARAPGDANASVRNVPSDNSAERWISDALLLYSDAPPPTIVPIAKVPTPVPEARPAP